MDVYAQSRLHHHLRRRCSYAHRLAESYTPFLSRELTPAAMARLLSRLEALWAVLERRVGADAQALSARGIDVRSHLRLPLLRRDRRFWGGDAPRPNRIRQVRLASELSAPGYVRALGCLYVLCGARLGGAIVGRHLQRTLAHSARTGLSFWFVGASEARPSLMQLMRRIENLHLSVLDVERLVLAAQASFASYSAWMGGAHARYKL